jgi:hypothetical protein
MKLQMYIEKFWDKYKFIIVLFIIWRIFLEIISRVSGYILVQRSGYIGPYPWANFDGIHYIQIAKEGYFQFGEAFFPLYPILVSLIHKVLPILNLYICGQLISTISLLASLIVILEMLKPNDDIKYKIILTLLLFPTSFFFISVYTESLFLFLTVTVFYLALKKKWFMASIIGFLASLTKVYGIVSVLLIFGEMIKDRKIKKYDYFWLAFVPLGLMTYMYYQYIRTGDPFIFFHVQPAFGANRSGGNLIILPQVYWRYIKMIFLAYLQPTLYSYVITILEFFSFNFILYILFLSSKINFDKLMLVYSSILLIIPTLTGTLSSMPRYYLSVFPLFFMIPKIINHRKFWIYLVSSLFLQIILVGMFVRGYFVG